MRTNSGFVVNEFFAKCAESSVPANYKSCDNSKWAQNETEYKSYSCTITPRSNKTGDYWANKPKK
jgi:hypothetical protein